MAYARQLAPLALFLLATSVMFPTMKIVEAGCPNFCSPSQPQSCGSNCVCAPVPFGIGGICLDLKAGLASVAKMITEHPNLCQTHDECMEKGSGNFCARFPNYNIDYGWCFDSNSEELKKGFLAMPRAITK